MRGRLDDLNNEAEQENYRRLLPGYVRRFVEKAAPLIDLRIEGDPETTFAFVPDRPGAGDPLLSAIERYTEHARQSLTVYKPATRENAIWLHPGEPVFDALSIAVLGRFSRDGLRGAVFIDPYATEPYLFHVVRATVEQHDRADREPDLWSVLLDGESSPKDA